MPAIRPGPFSRGPFTGQQVQLDNSTGEILRAPLYVCAQKTRAFAPDLFPNLAVLAVLASPGIPHAPIDPQILRRPAPQIDVFTNVAVLLAASAGNVSAFDDLPARKGYRFDLFPNLSVGNGVAPTPLIRSLAEPTQFRRAQVQIDLTPNLAIATVAPATLIRSSPEPLIFKRAGPAPELAPNLALRTLEPFYAPPGPIEPTLFKRVLARLDIAPNLAVNTVTFVYMPPPALAEPVATRRAKPVELYPNIAVNLQTQVTQGTPEPAFTRKPLTTVELFPNLALLAPVALVQLNELQEPTLRKRVAQVPEVFQNRAIYAPAELKSRPQQGIEPTYTRRLLPQLDVFPNLAALIPPVIALTDVRITYTADFDSLRFDAEADESFFVAPTDPTRFDS